LFASSKIPTRVNALGFTTYNLITIVGIVLIILASVYVYHHKKNKFQPGTFFLLLGACFAISAGLVYSVAIIIYFGFNSFVLDFSYNTLTIPALVGSIGGTATLIYNIKKYLVKNIRKQEMKEK
jgi:hypothetical protein